MQKNLFGLFFLPCSALIAAPGSEDVRKEGSEMIAEKECKITEDKQDPRKGLAIKHQGSYFVPHNRTIALPLITLHDTSNGEYVKLSKKERSEYNIIKIKYIYLNQISK